MGPVTHLAIVRAPSTQTEGCGSAGTRTHMLAPLHYNKSYLGLGATVGSLLPSLSSSWYFLLVLNGEVSDIDPKCSTVNVNTAPDR